MGACFSAIAVAAATSTDIDQPTAKVVVVAGSSLVEYSVPVRVSQVLGLNSMYSAGCFLCNSDSLRYGDYIEALGPDEFVRLGQLYFMLTLDKLDTVLSGPDMAALAVKASSALGNLSKSRRGTSIRVMPIDIDGVDGSDEYVRFNEQSVVGTARVPSWHVRNKKRIEDNGRPKMKKMKPRPLNAIEEVVEEAVE